MSTIDHPCPRSGGGPPARRVRPADPHLGTSPATPPRRRPARALRAGALTLLCGLALLLGAGPAAAHTRLLGSDPADGASLDAAPARVALEFTEAMQPEFSTITVIGPDGTAYQSGAVTADGRTIGTAVAPLGPAGRYEIGYRVISEDGHPVTGSVAFTLTAATAPAPGAAGPVAAPASAPAAAAAPAEEGGAPVWPWIVGAVVLVGGGVAAALRLGRG